MALFFFFSLSYLYCRFNLSISLKPIPIIDLLFFIVLFFLFYILKKEVIVIQNYTIITKEYKEHYEQIICISICLLLGVFFGIISQYIDLFKEVISFSFIEIHYTFPLEWKIEYFHQVLKSLCIQMGQLNVSDTIDTIFHTYDVTLLENMDKNQITQQAYQVVKQQIKLQSLQSVQISTSQLFFFTIFFIGGILILTAPHFE